MPAYYAYACTTCGTVFVTVRDLHHLVAVCKACEVMGTKRTVENGGIRYLGERWIDFADPIQQMKAVNNFKKGMRGRR